MPSRRDASPTVQPLLAATTVVGNFDKSRALHAYQSNRAFNTNATVGDVTEDLPVTMRFGLLGALIVAIVGAGGTVGSVFLLEAALAEKVKLSRSKG